MEDQTTETAHNLATPIAIVIAGVLVAGALYFGQNGAPSGVTSPTDAAREEAQLAAVLKNVAPVTNDDHIRGNPDAEVLIVEYSDFECPFCKQFHGTMNQILDEYGKDGRVAWVYRHFPLDQLHPVKARREAVTSECVTELGGNDAFWRYADRLFELSLSNNQTDIDTVLPQIIGELGLSQSAIDACVASGKYDTHVQDNYDNALETGGQGTPWSVVIAKNGAMFPLSGAQPYAAVQQLIETALQAK